MVEQGYRYDTEDVASSDGEEDGQGRASLIR